MNRVRKEGQKGRKEDRALERVSSQFTGFLSCFQLIMSAKGIKDEMNSAIRGERGRTRGWFSVGVCVVFACLLVFVWSILLYLCLSVKLHLSLQNSWIFAWAFFNSFSHRISLKFTFRSRFFFYL